MKMEEKRNEVTLDLGGLNPKQKLFCQARTRYVAYGGARGGGKTHVARFKAIGGAVKHAGIRILFVRKLYPELEQTVILPMKQIIPPEIATYNGQSRMFHFWDNGSIIKFGHLGPNFIEEYQGQEWDWIFLDEATQFTEDQFRILGACLRGATDMPRRMFLTCNPGGVGHLWVKRLFVERDFHEDENPDDYTFIAATVEDNPQLLAASPEYVQMLNSLPDDVRQAWRYGDWDALAGTYFPEFRREIHVIPPMRHPPEGWRLYRAIDYGLDMFACLWIARDPQGRDYVYREVNEKNLIVSSAAGLMRNMTPESEYISATFAPPDMWSRQKDTGRTMAEIFASNGVPLIKASNDRIAGWAAVKELLAPASDGKPNLLITEDCKQLIRNLPALQHDEKNPNDVSTEPHEITHNTDALRYYAKSRTLAGEVPPAFNEDDFPSDDVESYEEVMCGGEAGESYLSYGGES